jgi:hypothetical protein
MTATQIYDAQANVHCAFIIILGLAHRNQLSFRMYILNSDSSIFNSCQVREGAGSKREGTAVFSCQRDLEAIYMG